MSEPNAKTFKEMYFKLRKAVVLLTEELRDDPTEFAFPIRELTKILEEN